MANKITADKAKLDTISDMINVGLYGGKSIFKGIPDSRYIGEVISCDCEHCSLRDKGMCLKVTSPARHTCIYGRKYSFDGYTPKAASCAEWKRIFTSHECYGKLKSVPDGTYFGVMDDYYFIYTVFVGVSWKVIFTSVEDNYVLFDDEKKQSAAGYRFGTSINRRDNHIFIRKDSADLEFIKNLLSYRPYSIMGGEITDYREKIVTLILNGMRINAPELYNALTEKYPELAESVPNYIGKTVYVRTLKPDIDITVGRDVFHLSADRTTLTGAYSSAFLPFGAKRASIIIEVTNDMKYKVTDNSQICEDTEIALF